MCVIAYKPLNVEFPSDTILKNCFENNPDGAGFMYAYQGQVFIQKGYKTWQSFIKALNKARKLTGNNVPYVMHFRIATQGFDTTMTHPFPLSSNMEKLKELKTVTNIGVAHNGVLSLTSDGAKTYSDTMKFITDYLSLIIRKYSWYKDKKTKLLIERLIEGSRLAILDKDNHCELLGKTWVEDNGIWYSNNSYSYKKLPVIEWDCDDYDYLSSYHYFDPYKKYYNKKKKCYDFSEMNCPVMMEDDDSYCCECSHCKLCSYYQAVVNG